MFGRPKSDVELLRASLAGSTQAFGVLVGRYQSLVCAITYGATGDVGRSEDLAQETFLRAWKSLEQLQDLGKFRAWLCSIARSTVQNWFRSEKSEVVSHAVPLDAAVEKASYELGPVEAVMFEEEQAVVRQALTQMPEGLREPLVLFYREGKSTREVAEMLGLSESAARQRISRGRSMLREQVAEMIETVIARTRPSKAFTTAVLMAIAGLGIRGSATAAAAGGSAIATSLMSGLTAKVAVIAVGAIIIAGGIVGYRQLSKPGESTRRPVAAPSTGREQPAQIVPAPEVVNADAAIGPAETIVASAVPGSAAAPEAQARGESSFGARSRQTAGRQDGLTQIEFEARGVLSGRITDIETGEPVRDARLIVTMRTVHTVETDASGFYYLEKIDRAGDYRVSIESREYVGIPNDNRNSIVNLSPDKQTVKHFQLPRACMVDVWVVDANGVGIRDARVVGTFLADSRRREINRSIYSQRTDPNGYLLLGGFPPADTEYLITAWHTVDVGGEQWENGQFTRSECDYAPARMAVRLTDPNVVRQIQIVLERGQTVHARAEYEDGLPAANTDFEFRPAWWHSNHVLPGCRTGSDGTFAITHITPGLYDIHLCTPTGDSGFMSRMVMQAQLPPANEEPLVIHLAGKSPQAFVSISGSLIFCGEHKPGYVNIEAYSRTGRSMLGSVKRGPGGLDTFTVDRLEPGSYTLQFSGDHIEATSVPNVVAPSSGVRVELLYTPKPKLTGAVTDGRTGAAIQDFRVRVKKLRSLRGPPHVQSNQWVHYKNGQGEFNLDVTGPGVYQVQAVAEEYAPAWSEPINTDAATRTVVALSAGGAISGRVIDEQGEPVGGARIVPLSLAGGTMSDTEDAFVCEQGAVESVDGTFTLRQVPPGMETLKVTHPGYAPLIVQNILVTADRTTRHGEIVLTRGGAIEGHVYDLQGRPQAGQVLYAQDAAGPDSTLYPEAGRLGQAVTDATGFYRLDHLPQRLCHIKRMDEWQSLGVVCRAILPREGRVLRMDLGGVPVVRGRVVLDGVPAVRSRLTIQTARSANVGAFRCYAVTDEQGNFTFGGAPPGAYAIHCERRDEPIGGLPIGTVTVGSTDADAGTLPANRASVAVTLTGADTAGQEWHIDSVSLTTGPRLWSVPAGVAAAPSKPGGPYVIRNIEPGRYILNVRRRDQVFCQKSVALDPDKGPWELAFDLPACKASVSGRIRGMGIRPFVLWREQKDVLAVLEPDRDGACSVRHLPAGRYWVGDISSVLYGLPPITEFSLREDEEKTLDLDLSAAPEGRTGFVLVQVVDENGLQCDGAEVRLDGPSGPAGPVYSEDTGQSPGFLTVPGEHTLYVTAPGHRDAVSKLRVKPFDPSLGRPQYVVICLDRR